MGNDDGRNGHAGDETGEEASSSPERSSSMMSGFGGDKQGVDGVRGVTPWLVVGSPTAVSARGGGGGSPEGTRWRLVTKMALEAIDLSTIYVSVYVGEW